MSWDERRFELIKELGRVLVKTGALQFGTFTLTSGKMSSYYIDLRIVPSLPEVFKRITDAFVEALKNMVGLEKIDAIGGIPTAGLTYATAVAYNLEKPLLYVRKEPREHGTQKRVEGLLRPGWRVLILDDLITTGGSILRAAEAIRSEGGIVEDALVLIDRMERGRERLLASNIQLKALTKITELADLLYDMNIIGKDQRKAIYGMVKIR
ncbi:MAG: orotate phosphoribosyltransferase [archaeon]|nr:orotate phosphoribosyltransferase [archaeon]MCP8319857.1 orotate phosphoribosyltransferase [archaeon]